jgi:GDP-4-dehydro-6-deoxy-D-mannose reductase
VKVLITGIAGFAGSHLAELALRDGAEVVGTVLPGSATENLAAVQKDVVTVGCDLTEPGAAATVLRTVRPDRVFHLAGASVVGTSWALRADVLRTNLEATYQLCEGLRRHPVPCLLVSSGEVYGVVPESEQPISEARRWAPGSPYALSKASQELYAGYYVRSEGIPLVIVRSFNHVGPRQGLGFVWSDVARQVAEIEKGRRPAVLEVGTTTTRRDFTDVRDMVRAYWLLLGHGESGRTYNAASGKATSIQEVIDAFLARATREIEVRPVAERIRPVDIPMLVGDASRLRALTGWAPGIPLQQTIEDVLDDWRQRV